MKRVRKGKHSGREKKEEKYVPRKRDEKDGQGQAWRTGKEVDLREAQEEGSGTGYVNCPSLCLLKEKVGAIKAQRAAGRGGDVTECSSML